MLNASMGSEYNNQARSHITALDFSLSHNLGQAFKAFDTREHLRSNMLAAYNDHSYEKKIHLYG